MKDDKELLNDIQKSLDDSVEHLDAHTQSRLNQARQQALQSADKTGFTSLWNPASGTAFAGLLNPASATVFASVFFAVVASWLVFNANDPALQNIDQAELILTDADIELVEDMEFIAWLIEQDNAG